MYVCVCVCECNQKYSLKFPRNLEEMFPLYHMLGNVFSSKYLITMVIYGESMLLESNMFIINYFRF